VTSPRTAAERLHQIVRAEILERLRTAPATRPDLERELGWSRSVVAAAVDHLRDDGLVTDAPTADPAGRGRPGRTLVACQPTGTLVGVDFGHDHIAVAVADSDLAVHAERRLDFTVDEDVDASLDTAAALVAELLGGAAAVHPVVCCVGVPGPLDAGRRAVASPTILSSWSGLDLADRMAARTGLRIVVENDANLGATAELHDGAGRGLADVVYVKGSGGVGASVVIGGRLVAGSHGGAGEIGHTQLRQDGAWCRCGNRGCLETIVSVGQVLDQIGHLAPPAGSRRERLLAVREHPVTRKVMAESGRTLGVVLANMCALLDPQAIVVGGELADVTEDFVDGVRESVERLAQPGRASSVSVSRAAHGTRAELVGALITARNALTPSAD
jgi:predicted NBD/HSP70 family sugar kinase